MKLKKRMNKDKTKSHKKMITKTKQNEKQKIKKKERKPTQNSNMRPMDHIAQLSNSTISKQVCANQLLCNNNRRNK